MHNYPFRIVKSYEYRHCRHRDTMFRRHCVVAEVLKTTDWVLFIDADIGVINPNRLIEEYIDTNYDITFYDRFCSWEVAMGSYIVKNTDFSRIFLMNFANFETHLPDSFHGSDNGAIHAYLLETLAPESRREAHVCYSIWHQSSSFDDLFLYEACIRSVLGSQRDFGKVRIVRKFLATKSSNSSRVTSDRVQQQLEEAFPQQTTNFTTNTQFDDSLGK
ncbi:unnamed protein product [Strongylus vulgaris]|uniref:Nucleotide-diphospho-sugar transferase domain-containing protein n=1 Tax=Strongylus vulgaris TaxID=40348 RepID=A0A3P7JH31_STRVU|nr:unnamed protein product [Strongylus vulgaris]